MTTSAIARYAFLTGLLLLAGPLYAQDPPVQTPTIPAAQPAATEAAPATQPPEGIAIEAEVIEVKGHAQHAPVGTAVTDAAAWQPVQLNDRYPAGTLVRTGLGSCVILRFGQEEPYTVVMVERMTLASLAALYRTATDKVARVNVNYGAVRGGVSEGGLRLELRRRQHRSHPNEARDLGLPHVHRARHGALRDLPGRRRHDPGPQSSHPTAAGPLQRPVRQPGHDPLGRTDDVRPAADHAGPLRPDG